MVGVIGKCEECGGRVFKGIKEYEDIRECYEYIRCLDCGKKFDTEEDKAIKEAENAVR